jgi:hypothetical protein
MNADRSQLAALSVSSRAYLVTLETMRALVEELHAERDEARAQRDALAVEVAQVRAALGRVERRERIARFRRKRGRA